MDESLSQMAEALRELKDFIIDEKVAIKHRCTALEYILGYISSDKGTEITRNHTCLLTSITSLALSKQDNDLCEMAYKCLINLVSTVDGAEALLHEKLGKEFYKEVILQLQDGETQFRDLKCQTLANASRFQAVRDCILDNFLSLPDLYLNLVAQYDNVSLEIRKSNDFLAFVFGNLAQEPKGKTLFLVEHVPQAKTLISYTCNAESETRRTGASLLVLNLAFHIDSHQLLLEEMDILSYILLPLMGPEVYDDDEMEQLPLVCQYLDTSKTRDIFEVRKLLLKALYKLCCKLFGRTYLRDNGAYYVLREMHQSEEKEELAILCEDVIEILIRDEPDIGVDDLMTVDIPTSVMEKYDMHPLKEALSDC